MTLPVAVYFNLAKRFNLNRALYKPGTYKAELTVSAQRGDIDEKFIRPIPPAQSTMTFSVRSK